MATLVFTAIGTAIGGPLGGALGSLLGNSIDRTIAGPTSREGPRLSELSVSTSSYGTAIPRIHGQMRVPGTIVWATDLVERKEKSGGGKSSPSVTTYSYSANFAVALASNPIARLGRIWADGNLLRGAAGDLKVGGILRIYDGHGDQQADPLIASDRGPYCPAFRGMAYCVFESLDLGEFGNRIPALSFEVFGTDAQPSLMHLLDRAGIEAQGDAPLPGLLGFADDGGELGTVLQTVASLYPLSCDVSGPALRIAQASNVDDTIMQLGEPSMSAGDADVFAPQTGSLRRQQADARAIPQAVRYYDVARDYQIGLQRADGRARPGRARTVDFPGTLHASTARMLASDAAERAAWARDTLSFRTAELSPQIRPGSVVKLPGRAGTWRVEQWEWRDTGVELLLQRIVRPSSPEGGTDAGDAAVQPDILIPPTLLDAFELPFDGTGDVHARRAFAAATSATAGWRGAMLYRVEEGQLLDIQPSGRVRSVTGILADGLSGSVSALLERQAGFEVILHAEDFALDDTDLAGLLRGENLAVLGGEVLQFAHAERLSGARWRLHGLLRGRGGTEEAARSGHLAGTPFCLLDDTLDRLDPEKLGQAAGRQVAALGLGDPAPVAAMLRNEGISLRPLTPVHPRHEMTASGSLHLTWTRRARGAFLWADGVDVPLIEDSEAYRVGLGPPAAPVRAWETNVPAFTVEAAELAQLGAAHSGLSLWVRQLGRYSASEPLFLTTLP